MLGPVLVGDVVGVVGEREDEGLDVVVVAEDDRSETLDGSMICSVTFSVVRETLESVVIV